MYSQDRAPASNQNRPRSASEADLLFHKCRTASQHTFRRAEPQRPTPPLPRNSLDIIFISRGPLQSVRPASCREVLRTVAVPFIPGDGWLRPQGPLARSWGRMVGETDSVQQSGALESSVCAEYGAHVLSLSHLPW